MTASVDKLNGEDDEKSREMAAAKAKADSACTELAEMEAKWKDEKVRIEACSAEYFRRHFLVAKKKKIDMRSGILSSII